MFSSSTKVGFSIRQLSVQKTKPSFGLLVDIDGVIIRGKNIIPGAPETFNKYIVKDGKFVIPTIFLTNSTNALAQHRAEQLSEWLNTKVSEDQVVMANTPLRIFKEFHNKNVFITGQGKIKEIAQELGFSKIVTVDELRKIFPQLDVVDHDRRKYQIRETFQELPRIEAVLLNGEPVRWETALQLLIDILVTGGDPSRPYSKPVHPCVPILACNPDLQFMADAHMPRFGHGAFLLCLESLYEKITGNPLVYKVLSGKPSETTYWYAHQKIMDQANKLNIADHIKSLYAIGDNVNADVLGANIFNKIIKKKTNQNSSIKENPVRNCYSILVKTGVYSKELSVTQEDHIHRDFKFKGKNLLVPDHIVPNISEAVELIFKLEDFRNIN